MYRIYRKTQNPFQGDFDFLLKKWYILEEFLPILRLISWSLPDDEGGITCMYKTGQSVGGRTRDNPEKKHLEHLQAELGLSHVARAGLEPTPDIVEIIKFVTRKIRIEVQELMQ